VRAIWQTASNTALLLLVAVDNCPGARRSNNETDAAAGCSDDALTSFSATTRRSGARRPAAMHELSSLLVAKFHYTDTDTDPTRTRPDPHAPARTFLRRNSVGSVRVRSGPCSGI